MIENNVISVMKNNGDIFYTVMLGNASQDIVNTLEYLSIILDTGAGLTMLPRRVCAYISRSVNIYSCEGAQEVGMYGVSDSANFSAKLYFMTDVLVGGLKFPRFYFYVPYIESNLPLLGMDIIGRCDIDFKQGRVHNSLSNFNMKEYLEYYDNLSGYNSMLFPQLAVFTG